MASRIEDYGIIGNMRTAAIVSRTGSIDWFCAPDFDSDAAFAGLVGYDEHGHWAVRPAARVHDVQQRYDGDTLVLLTEFHCEGGAMRIVDFMPPDPQRCDIVRIIEGVSGEVPFEMVLCPRFGFGENQPWVRRVQDGWTFIAGPDAMILRTDRPGVVEPGQLRIEGSVKQGEQLVFQLAWYPSHEAAPAPIDVAAQRARTADHWSQWSNRCQYRGPYHEAVLRSLLTLKALSHAPTGAIVAAPTAGLPEEIGGVRNWDYRYCWLRDTSLTLEALMFGGYIDEAQAFRNWVLRAIAGDPSQTQIMYSIHGARRLTEFDVPWLPGYEGSKPVRVGNAASDQFQLDIYGETINAIYTSRKMGVPEMHEAWPIGRAVMEHVARVWQEPDDGIWEVRGGRRHFTYSKVMAWVAIDRAVRLIEELGVGGDDGRTMLPRLRAVRERIHEEVCDRGFNKRVGAFTQYYGGEALDASVLLMTHSGFLPAHDPRIQGTVHAIERDLVRDGFVLRYSNTGGVDGLPGTEGAFLACSFWLADNYAFAGRLDEAHALYDRLLGLRNHLGLLSEEWEPRLQRQIGNFPQGFSHLALVTTARIFETIQEGRAHPEPSVTIH